MPIESEMMNVGAYIPYSYKLLDYISGVIKSLVNCREILLCNEDFRIISEHECRNKGIARLRECDYIFMNDTDEIMLPADRIELVKRMKEGNYDVGFCPIIDYAPGLNKIYKRRDHKPAFIVKSFNQYIAPVKFYENRCIRHDKGYQCEDLFIHHFGYTYNEDIMKWKNENNLSINNQEDIGKITKLNIEDYEMLSEIRNLING